MDCVLEEMLLYGSEAGGPWADGTGPFSGELGRVYLAALPGVEGSRCNQEQLIKR